MATAAYQKPVESPAVPDSVITISSRIPLCESSLLARVITPLVLLKDYVKELKNDLLRMIWRELFYNEVDHGQLAHLGAFALFSVFAFLAYHQGVEDYVIYVMYALWPLEFLLSSIAAQQTRHGYVNLKVEADRLLWRFNQAGQETETQQLNRFQIRSVILRPMSAEGNPIEHSTLNAWRVFLVTHRGDDYLVHHDTVMGRATRKAAALAKSVGVPLVVEGSCGSGELADHHIEPIVDRNRRGVWRERTTSQGVVIYRNFSSLNLTKLVRTVLDESGSFIFLAIMAGILTRYGMFLAWMLGPKLGISDPFVLYLDLSFSGLLSFFAPQIGWHSATLLGFTLAIVSYSVWRHARECKVLVDERAVRFSLANRRPVSLPREYIHNILLIDAPTPSILLASKEGKTLLIEDLNDGEEQEELYGKLVQALSTRVSAPA